MQIVRIYKEHKHSCLLYVGSILVDEYATDPQCVGGLLEMLEVSFLVYTNFILMLMKQNKNNL